MDLGAEDHLPPRSYLTVTRPSLRETHPMRRQDTRMQTDPVEPS